MERMPKETWVECYGHLTTMEAKRTAILEYIHKVDAQDKLLAKAGERTIGLNGWLPMWLLRVRIVKIMGWIAKEESYNTWFGVGTAVEFDPEDSRVKETVERMAANGIIKVSKSGRAFKVMK